jgi:uncharacterized protein YigE (DUF2233 family)
LRLRFLGGWVGALVLAAASPAEAQKPIAWQEMGPGATRATLLASDAVTPIRLFRFRFDRFRAEVVVGAGSPPLAETATDLRRRRRAVAAVNGGFFDERGAPLGLRIAQARERAPLRRNVDWGVLLLDAAGARILHTHDLDPRDPAPGAIQVGPRLLVHGQPLKLKPQRARRTAVALERDGDALTLVVVDAPIDANELAAHLAEGGFDSAILLDGGPSTQLALDVGTTHLDLPGGYAVPDLLLIVARPRK